jgi:hypothetical protein
MKQVQIKAGQFRVLVEKSGIPLVGITARTNSSA